MPQSSQKVSHRSIASLRPYAANARTHSQHQIKQIADSIARFGFTNPVLVSGQSEIIAGHGRVRAAKLLGHETVPTLELPHLSAAERRAYVIADNKLAANAGWDHDILAHARTGGRVLGICGGFQMLGRTVRDPLGIEGPAGDASGLGLLAMDTQMLADKHVRVVAGRCARTDAPVRGYEIHSGRTTGDALARPMLMLDDGPDGAVDGLVEGTYVHGLFADDTFRRSWLQRLGVPTSPLAYDGAVDAALDELADGIEAALDVDAVIAAARAPGWIGG